MTQKLFQTTNILPSISDAKLWQGSHVRKRSTPRRWVLQKINKNTFLTYVETMGTLPPRQGGLRTGRGGFTKVERLRNVIGECAIP